ncbi:DUF2782 domain-containing protein [Derxia lacustris]|uniref:DUF2782 domain-containing protein n=1 Tax=Derxia lacustris TaxID=764842 RepID=UPI001592E49B|nr:DUF2782 domain-containing protein [Derxia lacustris]
MKTPSLPPASRHIPARRSRIAGLLAGLAIGLAAVATQAAEQAPDLKLEPVPDGAPTLEGGTPADITIRRDNRAEFKEYRVNGRLYAVKVTPIGGKPYWLIDRSGGGQLQRFDGPSPNLTVPSWLILEW